MLVKIVLCSFLWLSECLGLGWFLDMCIKYQKTESKESIKREGREQMHTCAHTQANFYSLGMDVFI